MRAIQEDPLLQQVFDYTLHGWPQNVSLKTELRKYFLHRRELIIEDDCLFYDYKLIIPPKYQPLVLKELHTTHFGTAKMKSLARTRFWWPSLSKDISGITQKCEIFLVSQKNPPQTTITPWPYPAEPGERIHSIFLELYGQKFLLMSDQHSKWLEIYPMPYGTTALETIACFHNYCSR